MDPKDRPDLIPLIDLDPEQADDVCEAMANVGLEVVRENLGLDPDREDFQRGVVRLYVPRTHLRDAREVVRGVLPEYGASVAPKTLKPTEEDSWSQIVAELRAEGVGGEDDGALAGGAGETGSAGGNPVAGPSAPVADFEEPGYQPPHPPPVPKLAHVTWLAWGAMLVGLVMLLTIAASDRMGLGLIVALVLFIGGFAGVISRARQDRFDDDDFGDGAVV